MTYANQFMALDAKGKAKEIGLIAAGKGIQLAGKAIKAGADLAVDGLKAMYGYVKDSIPLAAEYGSQMRQAAKFVDEFRVATEGANGTKFEFTDEYKNFYNELLGIKSIYTPAQLAEIAAQNAKAQIPAAQLTESVKLSDEMGAAFDSDAQTSGAIIRELYSNQKLSIDEIRELANAVNRVENESNADALALMRIIASQGSLADIGGIDQATLAAIGATLGANNGGFADPDKIATSLKNVVMYLNGAAGRGSKARKEAMGQLGLSAAESAKVMQQEGGEFLKGLLEQTMNLPADKRLSVLGAIFGQQASGDAAKLANNLDKLDEYMKLAHNKGGSTITDEYNYTMDDPMSKYAAFQNQLMGLQIRVGSALMPGLESFMDATFGPLGELIQEMEGPIAEFGSAFGDMISTLVRDENIKNAFIELGKQAPEMLGTLLPAIPTLAKGVATVAPALADLTTEGLNMFVEMVNVTIPVIAPLLKALANGLGFAVQTLGNLISGEHGGLIGSIVATTRQNKRDKTGGSAIIGDKERAMLQLSPMPTPPLPSMNKASQPGNANWFGNSNSNIKIGGGNAAGAIYTRPTTLWGTDFAEREAEAVLPLSALDDMINNSRDGGDKYEFVYAPVYNVGPGTDMQALRQTDAQSQREFEQRFDRMRAKRGRAAFAKG